MRILMVSASFHPAVGGAERQALALSKALRAAGHDARVLTSRLRGAAKAGTVDGVPVERGGPLFLASVFARTLLGEQDAVHVHMASSPAAAAAAAGRLRGQTVVVKVAGGPGYGEFSLRATGLLRRLKWAALRLLGPKLVAVSPGAQRELLEAGVDAALVPNGVELARFAPPPPELRERLRAELRWTRPVFLHVGRLDADARQGEALARFLEAWAEARRRGLEADLVVAGSGSEERALRGRVAAAGLGGSVQLLGRRDDVERLYAAADVFVLPGFSHGLSNALLEALASGLPALASDAEGVRGPCEAGREALLFDIEAPLSAVEPLLKLASDAELRRKLGMAARKTAQEFSIEAVAAKYLELYQGKDPS